MVKISVIIPVYNAAEFLDESINSLLNQTLDDFELICVNDGSKDDSLQILKNFAKDDFRFKIIDQKNAGCGAARNRALLEATGDYVYFFDPDDYIAKNTFEKLYENAINNKSDLVIFKIASFKDGFPVDYSSPGFDFANVFKGKNFDEFSFNYNDVKPYVLNRAFAPWTKLYKREFLFKYNLKFPTNIAFDDAPFHIESMLLASKISFVDDFFYFYRFNPNSIVNTSSNGIDIFKIINIVKKFLIRNKFYCEFNEEFKLFKITQILNYLISTNSEEYFQKAKQEFSKIQLGKTHIINHQRKERYELVLKCNNFEEYLSKEYELQMKELKNEVKQLNKKNKSLKKKNKNLNKKVKKMKRNNKKLSNSKSWKITKPLRKFTMYLNKI